MDREEILARSRAINKNQDVYEQEVLRHSHAIASWVLVILATVFFVAQWLLGLGLNYGLYALVFAWYATTFWVKWAKLRRRHELALAIAYTALVAGFSAAYLYGLVTTSMSVQGWG